MLQSHILVQSSVGSATIVAELAEALPGVLEARTVTGSYDVVARAQADDLKQLAKRIVFQIQTIPGVMRTATCIIHQSPSNRQSMDSLLRG
jgi:DNA-binding Lrp family transcriptional regulator